MGRGICGSKPTNETYSRQGESTGLTAIQWLYQAYGCQKYQNGQTYTLTIYVEDEAGNIGSATSAPFTFKKLQADDMMYLSQGWNFISVPATLSTDANTLGEIFAAQGIPITAVYAYDPSQSSPWEALTSNSTLNVLDGYWVNVSIYHAGHNYDFADSNGNKVDYVKVYFSYNAESKQSRQPRQ